MPTSNVFRGHFAACNFLIFDKCTSGVSTKIKAHIHSVGSSISLFDLFSLAGKHCFAFYSRFSQPGLHRCGEAFFLFYRFQSSFCLEPVWRPVKAEKKELLSQDSALDKLSCSQKAIPLVTFN